MNDFDFVMAAKGKTLILLFMSCCFFFLDFFGTSSTDTLLRGQELKDYEFLISGDGTFKLGFFSLGSSRNRYLGIWYNFEKNKTLPSRRSVVWVANRNNPIPDASGILAIDEFGKLRIYRNTGSFMELSSAAVRTRNISATLMNSGNFVLKQMNSDGSTNRILWESFDYPTDTLLPGMKLGLDLKNQRIWLLTSWINDENPGEGSFSLTIGLGENAVSSQLVIWWNGSIYWTSGMWRNDHFELVPRLSYEGNPHFSFNSNSDGGIYYFTYSLSESENSMLSGYIMGSSGSLLEGGSLAPFGACSHKFDLGCVQQKLPSCRSENDWFMAKRGYMADQGQEFDQSYNLSHFDCQEKCLQNCSCIAYAYTSSLSTCEIWGQGSVFQENYDLQDIYVLNPKRKAKWWVYFLPIAAGFVAVLAICLMYYLMRKRIRLAEDYAEQEILLREIEINETDFSRSKMLNEVKRDRKKSHELHFFSFESIVAATNNFSEANKLGQGGFGSVYKGELHDGLNIAIKRLARNSGQGQTEFKNELMLIAKLQHTNLVKLVGCCIQKEEKILIYEFMSNKSLDFFLFDPTRKKLLDWKRRVRIIEGIAQGLLYLHKHSRLRIIHRDMKASNILLDAEMNPRISDFGMARISGKNELEAQTSRVVGTHGYMAPEYVFKGKVSTKIDVFSFGVLLLEIVSGKKSNSNYSFDIERPLNLIGLAWELWSEGKGMELMDPSLEESCSPSEVISCIQIGLLCVQDKPTDRPEMSDVVAMLSNQCLNLSAPKKPVFFINRTDQIRKTTKVYTINNVSITAMEAR